GSGPDRAEQAVVAVLPQRADLGEAGVPERADVRAEPLGLGGAVVAVLGPRGAERDRFGERRVGGDRVPPGRPVLGPPGGEAPPLVELADGALEPRERRGGVFVQAGLITVEEEAARAQHGGELL